MGTQYSHLTLEERCRLRGLMEMELSKTEIARRLGRHRSTIYREFGRNRNAAGYRPDGAGGRNRERQCATVCPRLGLCLTRALGLQP